jgi:hypothetical protein
MAKTKEDTNSAIVALKLKDDRKRQPHALTGAIPSDDGWVKLVVDAGHEIELSPATIEAILATDFWQAYTGKQIADVSEGSKFVLERGIMGRRR